MRWTETLNVVHFIHPYVPVHSVEGGREGLSTAFLSNRPFLEAHSRGVRDMRLFKLRRGGGLILRESTSSVAAHITSTPDRSTEPAC